MRKPFQMYSHIGDLKVVRLKSSFYPLPFIGVINHTICSGLITSSKINRLRKDGMSLKYFRNNYLLSSDIKKICKQPLTIEYKSSQLISKKFIKSESPRGALRAPRGSKFRRNRGPKDLCFSTYLIAS